MLTKNDLFQIKQVVEDVIEDRVDPRFKQTESRFDKLETRFDKLETKVDSGFKKVNKKLNESFDYLDRRFIKHNDRLEKIELNLGLPAQTSL